MMTRWVLLTITLMAISCDVLAEPIVIRDYGNTRPSGIPSQADVERLAARMDVSPKELVRFTPYHFPTTSTMQLGQLKTPIKHGKTQINPFFIVGGEKTSQGWIERNKQYLLNSGITRGLLTNVDNANTFKVMAEAAKPLQLFVMNTDEIGKVFNINVYPIVITHEEIKQ